MKRHARGLLEFQWEGQHEFDAELANTMWMKGEPNNFSGNENCVRAGKVGMLWKRAQWNDAQCGETNPYVCAYQVTTTSEAPTSTTTWATTTTTEARTTTTTEAPTTVPYSPNGDWEYFDESGCWYQLFSDKRNAKDAARECNNIVQPEGRTFLASPQTVAEAQFVASLEGKKGKPRWVAGQWDQDRQLWAGEPGYPVRPQNIGFYEGEPSSLGDTRSDWCLQQSITPARKDNEMWKFNDAKCVNENRYVCQHCQATTPTTTTTWATSTTTFATTTTTWETSTTTHVTTTTTQEPTSTTTAEPTTAPWKPPTGWEFFEETQCHYMHSGPDNTNDFYGAKYACEHAADVAGISSRLATVSSQNLAKFLGDLSFSSDVKDGKARWVASRVNLATGELKPAYDDAIFTTDSWYPNEPSGNGECVQQGYSTKKQDHERWRLNNQNCNERNAYVCEWCGPPLPTTTTSTEAPTTTTTTPAPVPCTVPAGDLTFAETASADDMIKRLQTIGGFVASYRSQENGRTTKARQTCEAVCKRETWGLGCAPCPLEFFTDADSCFAPGAFGTGQLCRTSTKKGIKSFLAPLQPCCMREADGQTCGVPLDAKCDCSLFADDAPLFKSLDRDWDGAACSEG
jgi:hypothetical protein